MSEHDINARKAIYGYAFDKECQAKFSDNMKLEIFPKEEIALEIYDLEDVLTWHYGIYDMKLEQYAGSFLLPRKYFSLALEEVVEVIRQHLNLIHYEEDDKSYTLVGRNGWYVKFSSSYID